MALFTALLQTPNCLEVFYSAGICWSGYTNCVKQMHENIFTWFRHNIQNRVRCSIKRQAIGAGGGGGGQAETILTSDFSSKNE